VDRSDGRLFGHGVDPDFPGVIDRSALGAVGSRCTRRSGRDLRCRRVSQEAAWEPIRTLSRSTRIGHAPAPRAGYPTIPTSLKRLIDHHVPQLDMLRSVAVFAGVGQQVRHGQQHIGSLLKTDSVEPC
jgi:hypothetical protein